MLDYNFPRNLSICSANSHGLQFIVIYRAYSIFKSFIQNFLSEIITAIQLSVGIFESKLNPHIFHQVLYHISFPASNIQYLPVCLPSTVQCPPSAPPPAQPAAQGPIRDGVEQTRSVFCISRSIKMLTIIRRNNSYAL